MTACGLEVSEESESYEPPTLKQKVMVVFNSPIGSYVSPSFYSKTKPRSGQVVPTWFFSAVQVYGTLTFHASDLVASSRQFLHDQAVELTTHSEEYLVGFPAEQAWKIEDAPEKSRNDLMKKIVGIEINITRIGGKGKSGQEIAAGDQMGCIRGFEAMGTDNGRELAQQIATAMRKKADRADVLEQQINQVQGEKVKGPHGWYFTAAESSPQKKPGNRSALLVGAVSTVCMIFLLLVAAHFNEMRTVA